MTRPSRTRIWQRFAIMLVLVAAGSAVSVRAGAQLFEDRSWFGRPRHQQDFPYFGHRGSPPPRLRPQQPVESFRAPPPRKVETPPTKSVLVIGDSLAEWLAFGFEEVFSDTPEIGIVRKIRPYSGLVRYDARNDMLEWPEAVKELLASENPSAIVVMLGLNDRQPLRERVGQTPQKPTTGQGEPVPAQTGSEPPGQQSSVPAPSPAATVPTPAASEAPRQTQIVSYGFHTDKWAELYSKRIDEMIAVLKTRGVPVLWLGLPAISGANATGEMSYLAGLYRARAEKAGITYVNIWDGFVDDQGRYAVQGPDFEGQIRRLRGGDGVHFTTAGALKLAHYAEHDLRRLLSKRVVPIALPGSDAGGGTATAIGPVVPLDANAGEGGELLGAGRGPAPAMSDPIATRVMSRGAAIAAPAGRADEFSWPRAEAKEPAPTQVEVVPPAPSPTPAAPPATSAKDAAGKNVAKKPSDAKKESVPNAAPAGLRRSRAGLDGAPRPPLPVGANAR
jgi:hypothetical protein